jgi:hypothetical protein
VTRNNIGIQPSKINRATGFISDLPAGYSGNRIRVWLFFNPGITFTMIQGRFFSHKKHKKSLSASFKVIFIKTLDSTRREHGNRGNQMPELRERVRARRRRVRQYSEASSQQRI